MKTDPIKITKSITKSINYSRRMILVVMTQMSNHGVDGSKHWLTTRITKSAVQFTDMVTSLFITRNVATRSRTWRPNRWRRTTSSTTTTMPRTTRTTTTRDATTRATIDIPVGVPSLNNFKCIYYRLYWALFSFIIYKIVFKFARIIECSFYFHFKFTIFNLKIKKKNRLIPTT